MLFVKPGIISIHCDSQKKKMHVNSRLENCLFEYEYAKRLEMIPVVSYDVQRLICRPKHRQNTIPSIPYYDS